MDDVRESLYVYDSDKVLDLGAISLVSKRKSDKLGYHLHGILQVQ